MVVALGKKPSLTGEFIEEYARDKQGSCTVPSPTGSTARRVALPLRIPKASPPYNLSAVPRQRNRAQMKEKTKTSERELSDEARANLSDGKFKTLVIKMLTELIELGHK